MNMESVKVKNVTPQQNLFLLVEFDNGIRKKYDVSTLFEQFPEYQILKNKPMFDTVHVDCGGYAVAWTPEIDISEWELWDNGVCLTD
jgi:hypothetical protein